MLFSYEQHLQSIHKLWDNSTCQQCSQKSFSLHTGNFEQPLFCRFFFFSFFLWMFNILQRCEKSYHWCEVKLCWVPTDGLGYNGPGPVAGVLTHCHSTECDLWWKKKFGAEIFTCMELARPLKGSATVKNSVLWSRRPWPPYRPSSVSSLILYLVKWTVLRCNSRDIWRSSTWGTKEEEF